MTRRNEKDRQFERDDCEGKYMAVRITDDEIIGCNDDPTALILELDAEGISPVSYIIERSGDDARDYDHEAVAEILGLT